MDDIPTQAITKRLTHLRKSSARAPRLTLNKETLSQIFNNGSTKLVLNLNNFGEAGLLSTACKKIPRKVKSRDSKRLLRL